MQKFKNPPKSENIINKIHRVRNLNPLVRKFNPLIRNLKVLLTQMCYLHFFRFLIVLAILGERE